MQDNSMFYRKGDILLDFSRQSYIYITTTLPISQEERLFIASSYQDHLHSQDLVHWKACFSFHLFVLFFLSLVFPCSDTLDYAPVDTRKDAKSNLNLYGFRVKLCD